MKLSPIEPFQPMYGDDLPVRSMRLEDMPEGYHFKDLACKHDCPLTSSLWLELTGFAERWFAEYEVVAPTAMRFKKRLQNDYDMNADTLEKMLQVYNDDIAKPLQSRTIKRTYDLTDTDTGTVKDEGEVGAGITEATSGTVGNKGSDKTSGSPTSKTAHFERPLSSSLVGSTPSSGDETAEKLDSTVAHEDTNTYNTRVARSGKDTQMNTRTDNLTSTKKGTETEEWSDVGVAPNYVLLNGFIDNNRTAFQVFTDFFKDNFTLTEGLTW